MVSLKQTTTVYEYVEQFINLMSKNDSLPEKWAVNLIINGLKPEFEAELRYSGVSTLKDAFKRAVAFDEKLMMRAQAPSINYVNTSRPRKGACYTCGSPDHYAK